MEDRRQETVMEEEESRAASVFGINDDDADEDASIETARSWVVMVSAFLVQAILIASTYLPSSYYIIFHEEYETGLGMVSWIGAMNSSLFLFIGPLSSTLCEWFGSRMVLITGALVASMGMLISGFAARSVPVLIVTMGVIPGLGIGLAFTPSVIIVGYYFDKHRILATGFAMSGISAGIFFYPPIAQWLIEIVGWRSSLVIMAGFPLQAIYLAMLMKPVKAKVMAKLMRRERKQKGYVTQANQKDIRAHIEILQKKKFLVLLLVYLLVTFGISAVFYHMIAFAQTQGFKGQEASMLFSTIGIANLGGRLFYSAIGQHPKVPVNWAHFVSFVIAGLVTPMCALIQGSYAGFIIFAIIFGFFVAPHGVYMPDLAEQFLGLYHFGIGFGYIAMMAGVGTLAGPPAAGFIYDSTGSYRWTFVTGGVSILLGMVAFAAIAIRCNDLPCRAREKPNEMECETIDRPAAKP
ncbi:monocarboxylate transporter 12-like [Lineus longissimus]|uniref:monocarboxylate transporter 12-like n=1 Tax=Lineus longissimus TaxID=88925 RepID=UPI002B4EB5DA